MSQEIEFSPNYNGECQTCGQSSTVQVKELYNDKLIED